MRDVRDVMRRGCARGTKLTDRTDLTDRADRTDRTDYGPGVHAPHVMGIVVLTVGFRVRWYDIGCTVRGVRVFEGGGARCEFSESDPEMVRSDPLTDLTDLTDYSPIRYIS
jgi:hypothetical protein